jgi:DNA-binding NtrC family response regulator
VPFRLRLDLFDGPRRVVLPEGETVVGSAPESRLRVSHVSVSRRHARLRVDGDTVTVEDLGSSNGTRIDGRRITGETRLEVGSRVTFGSVEGCIEQPETDDLEAAVILPAARELRAPESDQQETPTTTLSLGSLRRFAVDHLPALLARLHAGTGTDEMARAAGDALWRSLPCLAVEVMRSAAGGAGILFSAGEPGAGHPVDSVFGDLRLTVRFGVPSHARAWGPVIETAARLVALAAPADTPASAVLDAPLESPSPASLEPAVRALYRDAGRIARGSISVLICGESGTGKEVLARYLHRASPRGDGPFVALNCAALPKDLLEAELFGVERGVATGVSERPGKFELANGGVLLLDEVADMAPETQAKLLRVLQERQVVRLGGGQPRPADVRVLAATNQDLDEARRSGRFRDDLYHRIADWRVELPPLRERRSDVANLAAHFLTREAERLGQTIAGISRAALDALERFDWPGNIRQLERVIARAALFVEPGGLVETEHLPAEIQGARAGGETSRGLREQLESYERWLIRRALAESEGDVPTAAERLAVGRSTLYRRIKELGIEMQHGLG